MEITKVKYDDLEFFAYERNTASFNYLLRGWINSK